MAVALDFAIDSGSAAILATSTGTIGNANRLDIAAMDGDEMSGQIMLATESATT